MSLQEKTLANKSPESDVILQRSPSILHASEQAVRAATNMERSDSVLLTDDESVSEGIILSGTEEEEEEPAIEAMLTESERQVQIEHSPRIPQRRRISSLQSYNRSSMTSGDFGEVAKFLHMESSDQEESELSEVSSLRPLQEEDEASTTEKLPVGMIEILESCGAMPLSLSELRAVYRQMSNKSADEIGTVVLNARTRKNRPLPLRDAPLTNEMDEAMLLHSLFCTFCSPPPTIMSVSSILELERYGHYKNEPNENVPLPQDSLISVSGAQKASVVSLLTHQPKTHLLKMPTAFQLAFFRILIRLLTSETDSEYNSECLFVCDWIKDDEGIESFGASPPGDEIQSEIAARKRSITERRKALFDRNPVVNVARRPNQLYTVMRFQSGIVWKEHAVTSLLNIFAILLQQEEDSLVLAPVSRLMGLCATAGITVKELREMLALAGRPFPSSNETHIPEPGLDRLLLIRAITTAAEGASRSSLLVGKASPGHFFSFGLCHGLARNFQSISNWPFRNDFGMAVWFRAENFDTTNTRQCPTLFSARTHDGGGIEVSLVPLQKKNGSDTPATVISVTVFDSQGKGKDESEVQQIKLERCILLPQVWYHVAVRHTRSRLKGVFSMSSRSQVSIMLDGKIMLTESLKFPKISLSETAVESPANILRGSIRRLGRTNGASMTIQCGANFEGQTGAFYVFDDNVSDTTLRSLYEVTGGTNGKIKRKSLTTADSSWDERRGNIAVRSHALSAEITKADVEEIVLSSHENDDGDRSDSNVVNAAVMVADMGDDGREDIELPPELSRASFGSKLFLVWDPRRVEDQVALDLHSGAHVKLDSDRIQAWHVEGAKGVIASIGGIQALVPVFQAVLCGGVERSWPFSGDRFINDSKYSNDRKGRKKVFIMIPCLLSFVSAFIRDHNVNAREMLRCGGIDILEQLLVSNKTLGTTGDRDGFKDTLMSVLSVYPSLSELLVASLLELRSACSHYTGLETIIFSRLLFNFYLWFTAPSRAYGVALYGTLLPVLSSISKTSPQKVRDCVGVRPMVDQLREYTDDDENEDFPSLGNKEALTELFDRSRWSGLSGPIQITSQERRHIVKVLLAMVCTLLASGAPSDQLQPLLNYISYHVDLEWEEASQDIKDRARPINRVGRRLERFLATIKASTVLLCLLQIRPEVSGFISSMATCCGGELGAAGWILCCLVNTYDDDLRSIGLRCFSAYMDRAAPGEDAMLTVARSDQAGVSLSSEHSLENSNPLLPFTPSRMLASNRLTSTISTVGRGLAAIGNNTALSQIMPASKVSGKVVYKLLWHLLKCHRDRSGNSTHAALLQIILEDGELMHSSISSVDEFVIQDDALCCGFTIKMEIADASALSLGSYSGEALRQTPAISTVLLLLRFFPLYWREQWLRVLFEVCQSSRSNVEILLLCSQWQPPLFHLVSDIVEEMATKCSMLESSSESERDRRSDISSSFDICFKLYGSVLGHCFRHGGEQSLQILEQAASLQRTCVNGQEVLTLILGHLLADLNSFGTIETPVGASMGVGEDRNRSLKQSARMVTNAIMAHAEKDGFDTVSAVKQWRCLRHLAAILDAVVTKSGFGVADLFDYRNQHASSLDVLSGGLYGIRLSESVIDGMTAEEYASVLAQSSPTKRDQRDQRERDLYRQTCVSLAAQALSLLDSFIFPASLDASLPVSQLHGLALVRSSEPRLGVSQGPILASLVRLSLVLLSHLEPSSVKFLQCCSRLRCLLHWMLELVRESVSLAGYSTAFNELTAPLDRLLLAIVLQCHRGLARCSAVLSELEASHYSLYFPSEEVQKKNYKRTLRAALELREIVLAAFRGRNEVLRASLTTEAFSALQTSLETTPSGSKEAVIRSFLESQWATNFQDVDMRGNVAVPVQLTANDSAEPTEAGTKAIEALATESNAIIVDFNRTLDIEFGAYCEYQRQWAETDAVRDLEFEGDGVVQRLSGKYRVDIGWSAKQFVARADAAAGRFSLIERNVMDLWKTEKHWKLAEHTDRMTRRILLVRNRDFNDHQDASYELMLNKEREKAERDRKERERKKREKELAELMRRNPSAYVPYNDDEDDEEENADDVDDNDISENASAKVGSVEEGRSTSDNKTGSNAMNDESDVLEDDEKSIDVIESLDIDAWAKTFIWSSSESVVARFERVSIVALQTITEGRLLLTTHGLYFNQTGKTISVMTKQPLDDGGDLGPSSQKWRLSRLSEVHGRRFMLRAQALELFFSDSHELFMNFEGGTRERDRFYAKLRNSCKVPLLWSPKSLNPRTVFKRSHLTQLWRKRKISNFQYLMALNKMAGRSFNDITQYPVFPWVLADYNSEVLDLNDSRVYRDLSKPVGALNPDRLSQLIERYKELESFGFEENERFLYGSHYSSPGVVIHYMLRQEPFTTMGIELQSGRFDCPDRLFFDIAGCWNSCMTSSSDVKELIPEFFTCPEMFLNTNRFPLGSTQAGRPIDNVGLPPWAKGSAYEFVRLHRLALESDFVSQNLHKWIDLIFGYKQRGAEAETAHNVFHYLSYEGAVDLDKITDEVDRCAAESHIQNFGQTPCQLLVKEHHPQRLLASDTWQPLIYDISVPKHLRCHKPKQQFGGKDNGIARGAVVSIQVLTESILVLYADMSIGTYKWNPDRRGKHPFSFKKDKHRNLARRELSASRASIKRSSALPQSMGASGSRYAVGTLSFGYTLGGQAKENLRRKQVMAPSRLGSSSESLSTAEASSLLVSCGYWDDTIKVHSVDGSKLLCSVTGGHHGPIRCLAIGGDGGLMVTGGEDATCRVWVIDHPDMAIALSDGYVQTALGASNDREQLLSCCHVLWGHETPISCLALSSDLDVAVSASLGGTICVHTVRRGNFIRSIYLGVSVRSIVLDSHGIFVAHTQDGFLHVYTINDVFLCSADAKEHLHDLKITSNGQILITGGDKGHVVVRSVHDLAVLSMLDLGRHGPIRCISLTPAELNPIPQFLFIGSDDGLVTIVDRDPHSKSEHFESEYVSFKL